MQLFKNIVNKKTQQYFKNKMNYSHECICMLNHDAYQRDFKFNSIKDSTQNLLHVHKIYSSSLRHPTVALKNSLKQNNASEPCSQSG